MSEYEYFENHPLEGPFDPHKCMLSQVRANTLEKLIKFEFPKIKNLKVEANEESFKVSFDEGVYSKEEVESKVNEYRNNKRKISIGWNLKNL